MLALIADSARIVYWPLADVCARRRACSGCRGAMAECQGPVVSALPGHRRVDETPHRPQIKTQRSGMQVLVLTAYSTDADRTVDRRGRRACLLNDLPHEEIARGACGGTRRDDAHARRRPAA